MRRPFAWLCHVYGWLLRLYPRAYHARFADEMQVVFAQALAEAEKQGWLAVLALWSRELRDIPRLLGTEYWLLFHQWLKVRVCDTDPMRTDLPGVVPVGDGSIPHVLFVVAGRNPRMRRLFDLVIALVGLVLVAPLLLVLPIWIKLDSPGPVLYRQQRIGKHGQPYTLYKFRSMHVSAPLQTQRVIQPGGHDPRLTRVGRWIRRAYLDEMAQLFNVLKGDMSIFGPRPPMPGQ